MREGASERANWDVVIPCYPSTLSSTNLISPGVALTVSRPRSRCTATGEQGPANAARPYPNPHSLGVDAWMRSGRGLRNVDRDRGTLSEWEYGDVCPPAALPRAVPTWTAMLWIVATLWRWKFSSLPLPALAPLPT